MTSDLINDELTEIEYNEFDLREMGFNGFKYRGKNGTIFAVGGVRFIYDGMEIKCEKKSMLKALIYCSDIIFKS